MHTIEVQQRISELRHQASQRPLTVAESKEAVSLLRQVREQAGSAAVAAKAGKPRATKASKTPVNGDDLLASFMPG